MMSLRTTWQALVTRVGKIWPWVERAHSSFDKLLNTLKNMATTAATVGLFVYACLWDSHTTFQLAQANEDLIKLNVMTKAPPLKQSYARECRIHFDDMPIEDAQLLPADDPDLKASVVISPDQPKIITLSAFGLSPKCRKIPAVDKPDRFTKAEILPRIALGHATVTLSVQESNDGENRRHYISLRVPTEALRRMIKHQLPDSIPEKTPPC